MVTEGLQLQASDIIAGSLRAVDFASLVLVACIICELYALLGVQLNANVLKSGTKHELPKPHTKAVFTNTNFSGIMLTHTQHSKFVYVNACLGPGPIVSTHLFSSASVVSSGPRLSFISL